MSDYNAACRGAGFSTAPNLFEMLPLPGLHDGIIMFPAYN